MWVFVLWAVRRSLTRNKATLIGFLLGLVAWLAYTLPEFSVATVVVGLITIAIGMAVFRFLTPLMQAGAEMGYRIAEPNIGSAAAIYQLCHDLGKCGP